MDRAETIVRNRVDTLGVSEASIQRQGNDSILVQLPGIKDPQEALQVLGSTGQLEFVDVEAIDGHRDGRGHRFWQARRRQARRRARTRRRS